MTDTPSSSWCAHNGSPMRASANTPTHEIETAPEVSARLRVPLRTLYDWRQRGVGPPSFRVGRHVRYRRSDVDAWIAARVES